MYTIKDLLTIIAKLRHPEQGCPWDKKQTFESLAHYSIEEAYEVVDAIEKKDNAALCEELGDLLLQVLLHAQIAKEQDLFDFEYIVDVLAQKIITRHPHVFADQKIEDSHSLHKAWETQKAKERQEKQQHGLFDGIALALPSLLRAQKIQKRAAGIGFDWEEVEPVFDKIQEEILEVKQAALSNDQQHLTEEIGDVLFAVSNLARHYKINAEQALMHSNQKFINRIQVMETLADRPLSEYDIETLENLWQQAKKILYNQKL